MTLELIDFFTIVEESGICTCDICDKTFPTNDQEAMIQHLLNTHMSPIIHVYEVSNKERKNMTVEEFVKYANESYDTDIVVSLDEKEIDNVIVDDEDLTEYKVEVTVCRKGSCYVMAKDQDNAIEIFEKKLEHGYDEDKSIDWFDFDDEFMVDGEEQ